MAMFDFVGKKGKLNHGNENGTRVVCDHLAKEKPDYVMLTREDGERLINGGSYPWFVTWDEPDLNKYATKLRGEWFARRNKR